MAADLPRIIEVTSNADSERKYINLDDPVRITIALDDQLSSKLEDARRMLTRRSQWWTALWAILKEAW